jgi:heptosyltransferase-1
MNILIVRVSSLGDVVHNMPMVADLLRAHPSANIDWVVEEAYTGLVGLNRGVRKVIPIALRRWRKSFLSAATKAEMRRFRCELQSVSYDVVFDTQGLCKTSSIMRLARLAPGGRRIGLANATEGSGYEAVSRIFHDTSVPVDVHMHAVLRARTVAAQSLGYAIDAPPDFNLSAPQYADDNAHPLPAWMPDQPYAVFFHGTARADKQWAAANWIQVGQHLLQRGLRILLPWGSEAEKLAAQRLADGLPNATVLPRLPLMDAILLAQRAALAIGVDSGLTHVAAAYNRPTVELYIDSPRWKTQGDWSSNIVNLGDAGEPPPSAAVIAAIDRLLA